MMTRREFLDGAVAGAAGLAIGSTAKSYAQIIGSNNRLNFAVIGLNGRAYAHLSSLKASKASARISHVCDVESNILKKFATATQTEMGEAPATEKDFRNLLALKEIDAIAIASPDHWHAPMAIAGLQAGKHVYVEKPCSHNPAEGVMLIEAQKKTGKLVQMGSQQRSSPHTIEIVDKIHNGLIGRAYFAKAWYSNVRKSIGTGKEVPVPPQLDWDLFQGPAPRQAYKDNVQPYNWHWFKTWGTGESLNNGTHEVDVCRWALGVDYPNSVASIAGRYQFKDDWQFYDTMSTSFAYDDAMIAWEGKCCNGMKYYGRDRGAAIIGNHRHCSRRSRRLRDLRLEGQDDQRVQGRQQDRFGGPGRPRLDDGPPLRKLYRGHSEGREAEAAHRAGQRRRYHVATLEHRLGDEA
jgi:predicted dehydrogenase